eukprot:7977454-Pyramimonas_sp.AAC.1
MPPRPHGTPTLQLQMQGRRGWIQCHRGLIQRQKGWAGRRDVASNPGRRIMTGPALTALAFILA